MKQRIPKQIIIEVTSRCNIKCKFCPSLNATESDDMNIDLFKHIINTAKDECPDSVIIPWMNGEPLLRRDYADMIKSISDLNLRQYITTNGTIWNDDFFEHITDDGTSVYQIIFSLDGLKADTAQAARPGSKYETVQKTVEDFLKLKRRKNAPLDVGIKLCKRGQDYEEIESYIAYWLSKIGISYVCIGSPLTEINESSMRQYPCQYFDDNFMVIRADGRMVICAYNDQAVNKYVCSPGKIKPGDSLLEAYNNAAYTELRIDQANGVFHGPCIKCGFAYTGSGLQGKLYFRDKYLDRAFPNGVYYHNDYYNQFYSLIDKKKKTAYYGYKGD